jgi:hypothetical protein
MTTSSTNTANRIGRERLVALAPWLSRVVMAPPILIMILIGLRYIGNPIHAASPRGVALSTPEALTDTRVVGALALTVAFAIAASMVSRRRLRVGHATVVMLMALILAVRFFGFAQDGTTLAMGDQKVKTIGETLFLILNALGFALLTYLPKQAAARQ